MAEVNQQKGKLLILMEILWQDTDEGHPLTTHELLERLKARNISCDRRTLSKDMADLNHLGYEVMSVMVGHEKGYYTDDRKFSIPELRYMIDAVLASGFITQKKSAQMLQKIAALGGSHRAKLLQNNTIYCNTSKHENESVFYSVDTIEKAISEGKKVSFQYFDLDENKNKVYRKNGDRYLVEPVGMLLSDDRYYLTAISPDREGVSVYRLVRMDSTRMEKEPVTDAVKEAKKQITERFNETFKMYLGTPDVVTLEFENHFLGAVYDHFGENLKVVRLDENHLRARVRVQISPTFFGWLLQFGNGMRLTEPAGVVRQIHDLISQLPY